MHCMDSLSYLDKFEHTAYLYMHHICAIHTIHAPHTHGHGKSWSHDKLWQDVLKSFIENFFIKFTMPGTQNLMVREERFDFSRMAHLLTQQKLPKNGCLITTSQSSHTCHLLLMLIKFNTFGMSLKGHPREATPSYITFQAHYCCPWSLGSIEAEDVNKYVEGMDKVVDAVLAANGGHTRL